MSRLECKHDRLARSCTECEAEETIAELTAKLQAAEAENQELIKDYAEWMSPEDYVPLAQERDRLQAEVARLKARVIPESGGHIESADCWCGPTIEEHPGGTLIIHNQTH